MSIQISELRAQDAAAIAPLWLLLDPSSAEDDDLQTTIAHHLSRNAGLSLVAREGDAIVGLILCSRRGDRGCVTRLVVADSHKDSPVAKLLADKALLKMASQGIRKCGIDVVDKASRLPFWDGVRWSKQQNDHEAPGQFVAEDVPSAEAA